jgi:outer membrane protein assembly factor BamB
MKYVLTSLLLFVLFLGCNRAEETRRKAVKNNLKQIGEALKNYHETHESSASEFSHVIAAETEYYTTGPQQGRPPDGKFSAGTKVSIVEEAGSYVFVRSKSGVEAYVASDALTQMDESGTRFALDTSPKDVSPAMPHTTDWPRWRGPNANGVADGRNLPIRWSQTKNVRWSVKLPGWGTSSPVVYGNRVFVTSEVEEGDKKSLLTLCFARQDGKELWRHDFGFGVNQRTHEKSNLAVNTPTVTDDALYVAFGNADIARYSHDGKLIWINRYIPKFGDPKMAWGYALSPLVLDDAVLFPWDHHTGPCFLIGLNKQSGEITWKEERPIGTAHATPLLVEHHGQTDILVPGKNRLTAFDAKIHTELWQYGEGEGPFNGEIIVSPVYGDGMVFLQLWRESRIHAIRLTGNGKSPNPVWVSQKPGPVEPSLLYYRGLLYALMDNGVLVCLDGKTGKKHYRRRIGGNCNSSPIASDGRIYVSNNDGKTFVVRAGMKFELLETNDLGERITASPAISGNHLIYRTDSHLYCIGQKR